MAMLRNSDQAQNTHSKPPECKVINGNIVKFSDMVVHRFRMSDVDDPDIYAAGPMFDWERSEAGQFVFKHAVEPPWWMQRVDQLLYGFEFIIVARMKESDQTFYTLKYVGTKD
jgi:hypothetical protein